MKNQNYCRWSLALLFLALPCLALVGADEPANPSSKNIVAALQPFVDANTLAGAVTLVADKDKVLSLDTVGFADSSANEKMHMDTLFWIASESKPITGAALMLLVDEGKVKLDDPVEKFLPEFKDQWLLVDQGKDHVFLKRPRHPITIREIMNHTSGLPFRSALEQPTLDHVVLRDVVRSYAMTPLVFEPGTKFLYSNAGINTAGRIIEVVSGQSFEDFLQKRLFAPCGMKDTTFFPNADQLKRLAKSYKPNAAKNGLEETTIWALSYPLLDKKRQPMPGGGLFSTALDMGRFGQMVLNGGQVKGKRLLSEESIKQMTSKQTGGSIKESYGLGWATDGKTFGHGGAYATNFTVDPGRGLVTVFMVQHSGFPGNGGQSHAAFKQAAEKEFSKPR